VPTKAADHDFQPAATVTPVGIFLPASDEVFFYGVTSKVTSDCLVDRLVDWWETVKERFPDIRTLVINLDNGEDESQSAYSVHAAPRGVCPAVWHHDPLGLLSAVPEPRTTVLATWDIRSSSGWFCSCFPHLSRSSSSSQMKGCKSISRIYKLLRKPSSTSA
jgi:hypothetical protein